MDPSNWINLAATVVSIGAAVAAGIFAVRSNIIQKRLLDIEKQRDLLDLTPNISAARVNLHDNGRLLSVEISLTNLSQHTIHILAVTVFDTEANDLLALGRLNRAVQSSELIDVDFGAEPIPITTIDQQGDITTTNRLTTNLLAKANQIKIYFRYATTGNRVYAIAYEEENHHPLTKSYYLQHIHRIPFDPANKGVSDDVVIPSPEY